MPFIIAMLFGSGQILLTEQLFYAVNKHHRQKIFIFTVSKFLLYGIAVAFSINKAFWHLELLLSGFAVGVPIAAIVLYVYRIIIKK